MSALAWPPTFPADGPVRLRPYRDTDLDLVRELASDPYVPSIGTVPTPFTVASGLAYLARQHDRLAEGTGWPFAIGGTLRDMWRYRIDRPEGRGARA